MTIFWRELGVSMYNKPNKHTSAFLKRKAKQLRKSSGITHAQALDIVVNEHGYKNWKHFLANNTDNNPLRTNRVIGRPNVPMVAEVEYHDVIYGRVLGKRPNRTMIIKRHMKIGSILSELLEETYYYRKANKILIDIRTHLNTWLGYEYDKTVMNNQDFFSVYHRDHSLIVDDIPSITRQAQLRTLLRRARVTLMASYHNCPCLEKLFEKFDKAMFALHKWPKTLRMSSRASRQIRKGTFVRVKTSGEIFVVFHHNVRSGDVIGYGHGGIFEAAREELNVLRLQPNISSFMPMRLYIPFYRSKLNNGKEVLFNRDGCPLWIRNTDGSVEEADPSQMISGHIIEEYFTYTTSPYYESGAASLDKCNLVLREWGVIDKRHNILDRLEQAIYHGDLKLLAPRGAS